jgi:hypothetical protein
MQFGHYLMEANGLAKGKEMTVAGWFRASA